MARTVKVIALGGTIAMASREAGRGVEPVLDAKALLAGLPGLDGVARIEADEFPPVPGAHLRLADIVALAGRVREAHAKGADGVVITQGTDTIEETAFALDLLTSQVQPIVVTGAMRPPGQPGADGPANLLNAVRIAASDTARSAGVLVTMNDEIHAARFVRKGHASKPSAFTSAVTGPLGWVAEDRVRIPSRPSRHVHIPARPEVQAPPVALVTAALGEDFRVLERLADLGYAATVLAGFGAGHLPERVVKNVERLAKSMPVVLASRTGGGEGFRGTYGFAGSEQDLLSRGVLTAGALDPFKARILLSLALAAGWSDDRIADAIELLSS